MNVNWYDGDAKVQGAETVQIPISRFLDSIPDHRGDIIPVEVKSGVIIRVDSKYLLKPLGDYWKVMIQEGEYDAIRDSIVKYWNHRGTPNLYADVIYFNDEIIPLRFKQYHGKDSDKKIVHLNKMIDDINSSLNYDRTIIGSDGHNLEFQFLNKSNRREVKSGDYVDCGLFVSVNGRVKVSAGVHRLICTNGLTDTMHVWRGDNYKMGEEFMSRAIAIAKWLKDQADRQITDVRELSIVLADYSLSVVNKSWKEWSERIASGNLTWFDVIDTLTRQVRDTLSNKRYEILSVTEDIMKQEKGNTRCHVCQHDIVGKEGHKH